MSIIIRKWLFNSKLCVENSSENIPISGIPCGANAPHGIFLPGKEGNMSTKNYLKASDVAEIMGVSVPTAYKIIRRLNDELKAAGYITVCGKVSRAYFEHKTYSVSA